MVSECKNQNSRNDLIQDQSSMLSSHLMEFTVNRVQQPNENENDISNTHFTPEIDMTKIDPVIDSMLHKSRENIAPEFNPYKRAKKSNTLNKNTRQTLKSLDLNESTFNRFSTGVIKDNSVKPEGNNVQLNISAIQVESPQEHDLHNDTIVNISSKLKDEKDSRQILNEPELSVKPSENNDTQSNNELIDLSKLQPGNYCNNSSTSNYTTENMNTKNEAYTSLRKFNNEIRESDEDANLDSFYETDLRDQNKYIFRTNANIHESDNSESISEKSFKNKISSETIFSAYNDNKPPLQKVVNYTRNSKLSSNSSKTKQEESKSYRNLNNVSSEDIDKASLDETKDMVRKEISRLKDIYYKLDSLNRSNEAKSIEISSIESSMNKSKINRDDINRIATINVDSSDSSLAEDDIAQEIQDTYQIMR